MNWQNVKLILARELKDQLRDRRTLFTVLVLPLLLYPLMGMALLQVSQFAQKHSPVVWIAGHENLPQSPPLLKDGQIDPGLATVANAADVDVILCPDSEKILTFFKKVADTPKGHPAEQVVQQVIQQVLKENKADVAVIIPNSINPTKFLDQSSPSDELPKFHVFRNSAKDNSNIAAEQFRKIVLNWKQRISQEVLQSNGFDCERLEAFQFVASDVADQEWKQAATWSKILPFIVMIWCLTGAFYPAVDLCAGEKERGTFETLLSSPALRNEIAIGKLLTVITFSITTSLLNLLSMGFTGLFVVSRLGAHLGPETAIVPLGLPPLNSFLWLLLALVPIASLFSAVALAAASFAKSSKEGQYYLVPLMMISMPLMMLPMMPAAKLDLGTSLIPVSGLMLMLRGLIEGQYAQVAPFVGPVVAVTLVCCWLAIRWVVVQFNSESVIFRPSERFSVGVWLKKSVQERHDLPLAGHAILCGVLILVLKFFVSLGATPPDSWLQFSKQTVIVLLASVAVPAVLMAMFLTRKPARTLKLTLCRLPVAAAAILAAICLHPVFMALTNFVMAIYPPTSDLTLLESFISSILADAPGFWAIILVLAVAPAVFEELAFRGFILSGLQSWNSNVKAVVISSLIFGIAHSILQQSIITSFIGCMLGFVAIRTGSLIPCILYHFTHNSISTGMSMLNDQSLTQFPLLKYLLVQSSEGGYEYSLWATLVLSSCGGLLVFWFAKYDVESTPELAAQRERKSDWKLVFESFVAKISTRS